MAYIVTSNVSKAVIRNDIVKLSKLLEKGESLDVGDNLGYTPLHIAVKNQRLECLKMLLQHPKCKINKKSYEGQTSLLTACKPNLVCLKIVQKLLQFGADPNISDNELITPLHVACKSGNLKLVELLLKNGANINQTDLDNYTALHFAIDNSKIEIVEFLLKSNANTEIQDIYGLNPLMLSIVRRFFDAFCVLLPVTKNLNCLGKDNETAISLATLTGNKEMVYKLLEKNVNINSCDKYCSLALAKLYSEENFEIFQELWSRADFNILSKNDQFKLRLRELTVQDNLLILKHVLQTQNSEFKHLNSQVELFKNIFIIKNSSLSEEYFEKNKDDLFSIVQCLCKQEIRINCEFMQNVCYFLEMCPYRLELLQLFIEKFDFPIDSNLIRCAFQCHQQLGHCMLQNCSNFDNSRKYLVKWNLFTPDYKVKSLVEICRTIVRDCICNATLNNRKNFCAAINNLPCTNIAKEILLFKIPVSR